MTIGTLVPTGRPGVQGRLSAAMPPWLVLAKGIWNDKSLDSAPIPHSNDEYILEKKLPSLRNARNSQKEWKETAEVVNPSSQGRILEFLELSQDRCAHCQVRGAIM